MSLLINKTYFRNIMCENVCSEYFFLSVKCRFNLIPPPTQISICIYKIRYYCNQMYAASLQPSHICLVQIIIKLTFWIYNIDPWSLPPFIRNPHCTEGSFLLSWTKTGWSSDILKTFTKSTLVRLLLFVEKWVNYTKWRSRMCVLSLEWWREYDIITSPSLARIFPALSGTCGNE